MSEKTPRVERGDAVNLAANTPGHKVTVKGVKMLSDAVLLMDSAIRSLELECDRLAEALRNSACPRPVGRDDGTVGSCVEHGHCGCENERALASDKESKP